LRFRICETVIDTDRKVSMRANGRAGFRGSGIALLSPEVPLSSQEIMGTRPEESGPYPQGLINSQFLTGKRWTGCRQDSAIWHPDLEADPAPVRMEEICPRLLNVTVAEEREISPFWDIPEPSRSSAKSSLICLFLSDSWEVIRGPGCSGIVSECARDCPVLCPNFPADFMLGFESHLKVAEKPARGICWPAPPKLAPPWTEPPYQGARHEWRTCPSSLARSIPQMKRS
jgi:hypothetical protein